MRHLILSAAACLTACAAPGPAPVAQQAPAGGVWVFDDNGAAGHSASGALCAPSIWTIERSEVLAYASDGSDVGCDYRDPEGGAVTVFVTHVTMLGAGATLEAHRAQTEHAITTGFPNAAPLSGRGGRFEDGGAYTGRLYDLEPADEPDWRGEYLITQEGAWVLKVRATYPSERAGLMARAAAQALATARLGVLAQRDAR